MEYGRHFRTRDGSHASTVSIMASRGTIDTTSSGRTGGDLDRGERRRLQEYEDLVDQDYHPFHEKCTEGVIFSDKKLIGTIRGRFVVYGVLFSAKPIPLGGMFQVKLLENGGGGILVSAQSNLPHTLYV